MDRVTLYATDADPGQTISYFLTTAPSNATINSKTGAVAWVPKKAGTFVFRVKARDNGSPALFDEKIFIATVTNSITPDIRINSGGTAFAGAFENSFIADKYFSGNSGTSSLPGFWIFSEPNTCRDNIQIRLSESRRRF